MPDNKYPWCVVGAEFAETCSGFQRRTYTGKTTKITKIHKTGRVTLNTEGNNQFSARGKLAELSRRRGGYEVPDMWHLLTDDVKTVMSEEKAVRNARRVLRAEITRLEDILRDANEAQIFAAASKIRSVT